MSDAAILASRGLELNEITPDEYLGFFGNGYAVLQSYMDENPEVVEGFGRALVRGHALHVRPANKDQALAHMAAGNPQEGEDRDFAAALLDAVIERMTPTDAYMDRASATSRRSIGRPGNRACWTAARWMAPSKT